MIDFVESPDKQTSNVNKSKKKQPKVNKTEIEHGFMYIGHLPHGFYEDEIKSYFTQFGRIVRVRVARSAKTGNYRNYGFIEFENKDVAQIAADTMNNYLMFNKILKCHVIPKEKIHPDTFKNAGRLFVKPLNSILRRKFNRKRSDEQLKKIKERQEGKMKKRMEKLKEADIKIDPSKLNEKNSLEVTKPEESTKTKETKKKLKK